MCAEFGSDHVAVAAACIDECYVRAARRRLRSVAVGRRRRCLAGRSSISAELRADDRSQGSPHTVSSPAGRTARASQSAVDGRGPGCRHGAKRLMASCASSASRLAWSTAPSSCSARRTEIDAARVLEVLAERSRLILRWSPLGSLGTAARACRRVPARSMGDGRPRPTSLRCRRLGRQGEGARLDRG